MVVENQELVWRGSCLNTVYQRSIDLERWDTEHYTIVLSNYVYVMTWRWSPTNTQASFEPCCYEETKKQRKHIKQIDGFENSVVDKRLLVFRRI